MTTALFDVLRDAGVDLFRAHRLDAYLRAVGDEVASAGFARTLRGEVADVDTLRATLAADLDAIRIGLALLDRAELGLSGSPVVPHRIDEHEVGPRVAGLGGGERVTERGDGL